jgi:hypothetical protein
VIRTAPATLPLGWPHPPREGHAGSRTRRSPRVRPSALGTPRKPKRPRRGWPPPRCNASAPSRRKARSSR